MKSVFDDELRHHGIKGQRWGIRRYQNDDGSLTIEGKKRYGVEHKASKKYARRYTKDLNRMDKSITRLYGEKAVSEHKLATAVLRGNERKINKLKEYDSALQKKLQESLDAEEKLTKRLVNDNNYSVSAVHVQRTSQIGYRYCMAIPGIAFKVNVNRGD